MLCAGPHLVARSLGRSRWPRRFLAGAARICGAQVRVVGQPLAPRTLILANHTSWLDILVLASATGTRFVSKAELRDHWLLRWLADQNDTIYIERQRREVLDQAAAIVRALAEPRPLALFPEGTTGDGMTLLQFRSALLAGLAPPPPGTDIRAVAIDYGEMQGALGWTDGEGGKDNALRLLGRRGSFVTTVRLLETVAAASDRKRMAAQAQAAIADALRASNPAIPAL